MGAFGITAFGFTDGIDVAEMRTAAEAARAKGRVGLILVETPANPTNGLVDLAGLRRRSPTNWKSRRDIVRRSSSTTPCSARCSRSR